MPVGADEVDYSLIGEERPTWEEVSDRREHERSLVQDQQELIDFQSRLDQARDDIEDGEISKDELEALDDELQELMPASVKARMPEIPAQKPQTAAVSLSAGKAAETAVSTPTSFTP